MFRHFRIEETTLTQAEIETLFVNNTSYSVDCGHYTNAFTFQSGTPVDSLGSSLTLAIDGTVTVPGSGVDIEVDPTDSVTLVNVLTDGYFIASFQVVFTGEIEGPEVMKF